MLPSGRQGVSQNRLSREQQAPQDLCRAHGGVSFLRSALWPRPKAREARKRVPQRRRKKGKILSQVLRSRSKRTFALQMWFLCATCQTHFPSEVSIIPAETKGSNLLPLPLTLTLQPHLRRHVRRAHTPAAAGKKPASDVPSKASPRRSSCPKSLARRPNSSEHALKCQREKVTPRIPSSASFSHYRGS